jgi:hypothetical protein
MSFWLGIIAFFSLPTLAIGALMWMQRNWFSREEPDDVDYYPDRDEVYFDNQGDYDYAEEPRQDERARAEAPARQG